jgi:hypothetical protein
LPKYEFFLKLSNKASGTSKMTTLLFAIDFFKEIIGITKMENQEISLHFDEDNVTTLEEILMTKMD